jgi:class 3 adenylate cyclase
MDSDSSRIEESLLPESTTDAAALRKPRAEALETMRTEVTILFSDIKGSTSYFERRGDAEGLAMVQHHNDLLFPVIQGSGGRVVKTIGDAIMACFKDPVGAIRAAIRMQQVMEEDRAAAESFDDHIHIRVALHMGPGLEKDNDVYGDVVNASAKVQQQTEPDQIIITDVLVEAAHEAGAQCVKLGRAEMKGKDEAIELYAVAWSDEAEEQLLEEAQRQFEVRLREARRQKDEIETELEASRDQWRAERRRLTAEVEELEAEVERAKESAAKGASADLQAQIRYQLEEASRARVQVEREFAASQARWEAERARFQSQIDSLQGAALQAMEQTHNPARLALAVREQLELRLKEARKDWELQWESERRRLQSEIEYLKKVGNSDDQKEAARRAVLQKLGKVPSTRAVKSADEWQRDFDAERAKFDKERDELRLRVQQLERQVRHNRDEIRQEIYSEMRAQYEPKLEAYEHERKRLRDDLESATVQLAQERQRLTIRVEQLEQSIPDAQEAVRKQLAAELQADFDARVEEANRMRLRSERRAQDAAEEAEASMRRANKEIARLQEELKEAREVAFRAQRGIKSSTPSL